MVDFAEVRAAAARHAGRVNRTPVMTSTQVDARTGAKVYFKCENYQRTGSFKFRGALNALLCLSESARTAGVLSYSSGNHAQALALAGSILNAPTTIIMPDDSPAVKRAATKGYGASIILYDRAETTREALARELAAERGMAVIPPYDHPDIIAGQGTATLELLEESGQLDVLLVCCGGGGLLSGSAISAAAGSPGCRVIGVEPEAADDGCRSFRSGRIENVHNPDTIADGARTPSLGQYTFPIIRELVSDMITVSDDSLVRTMYFLWERMKTVVEPTGVLAAAALLDGRIDCTGQRVGVILSGGNVDLAYACTLFQSHL